MYPSIVPPWNSTPGSNMDRITNAQLYGAQVQCCIAPHRLCASTLYNKHQQEHTKALQITGNSRNWIPFCTKKGAVGGICLRANLDDEQARFTTAECTLQPSSGPNDICSGAHNAARYNLKRTSFPCFFKFRVPCYLSLPCVAFGQIVETRIDQGVGCNPFSRCQPHWRRY